jgi:predicted PhzF superfamily epimerase YddE/YHI9
MPGQPFVQIDAFTRESFGGNPVAVFLLPWARCGSGSMASGSTRAVMR